MAIDDQTFDEKLKNIYAGGDTEYNGEYNVNIIVNTKWNLNTTNIYQNHGLL